MRLWVSTFLTITLAATAVAADSTATAEWPGWLGPNRDNKSPDTGLLKEWPADGPAQLWKAEGLGSGFSSVVVSGGLIFTSGEMGGRLVLMAFSLDGKPKWKADVDAAWTASYPGSRGTPMVDSGRVYLLSGHGLLGCFDAKSGNKLWARELKEFGGKPSGWGYTESPLILGNSVVVSPGFKNSMVALDKATGRNVWACTGAAAEAQYSSALAVNVGGVPVVVNGNKSGLFGVDGRSGALLWSNKFSAGNTANCPTPAYADGFLFWANGYGKGGICLTLTAAGATEAWQTHDMDCHHGGYVIDKGYIYGNNGGGWACLDLKTGQKKWSDGGVGKGSLCWADGMLYLFSENGGQAALATCSPTGMEIKGRVTVAGKDNSWAHPVVVGGRLYLRYENNLYCFNVKAK